MLILTKADGSLIKIKTLGRGQNTRAYFVEGTVLKCPHGEVVETRKVGNRHEPVCRCPICYWPRLKIIK